MGGAERRLSKGNIYGRNILTGIHCLKYDEGSGQGVYKKDSAAGADGGNYDFCRDRFPEVSV